MQNEEAVCKTYSVLIEEVIVSLYLFFLLIVERIVQKDVTVDASTCCLSFVFHYDIYVNQQNIM